MQPYKYFMNLIEMPIVLAVLLIGVVGVLFGIGKTIFSKTWRKGIWFAGTGTVLTVLALLLCAGWNNTAYYPSLADLQSSLTIQNSCSSPFTLIGTWKQQKKAAMRTSCSRRFTKSPPR